VAAGDDDLDALGGELLRGGDQRPQVLARGLRGDAEDVGPAEAQRAAGALCVGGGREGGIDAARDHGQPVWREAEQAAELAA
jgi:hypothetical protein